jgi:hypothetical protein
MLSDLLKPSALFALVRAGLDPDTEQLLREFDQVVYISCNPETLAKNLNAVADTHDIARFAVFDQVRAAYLEAGGRSTGHMGLACVIMMQDDAPNPYGVQQAAKLCGISHPGKLQLSKSPVYCAHVSTLACVPNLSAVALVELHVPAFAVNTAEAGGIRSALRLPFLLVLPLHCPLQFPYTHHLECGVLLRRKQTVA